ncbi:MAG: insulinase family protein [Gammaproteobacteria bacterium]|nr:insulinase family protein [Gammaproteobacteria bacterium]
MNKLVAGLLMAALVVACGRHTEESVTASDGSKIFDMPYLMRDLDNGLRVIVVKTDYPDIVTIQIPVQTGSRNEVEPGKSGFAHFFEHMMFRGTEKYPAEKYNEILKKAGADQNAYTTDDYTNYHITFTKDDLEKVIEIEADRFQNLQYSEEDFRTEALAVKGEYLKNFSDPSSKAYERIRALAFKDHTYRHTTMGFIEDIEMMPDQIEYSKTFFDRWYRPEKTALILVGDVDPEASFDLVKKYFGSWKRGKYTAEIPAEPPPSGPVYEHIQWDSPTQPYLFIAFRGPAYAPTEKDMPSMDLLSSIYFSDSSELYRKLVLEDQSVDLIETYFPDRKDPNLLMIYARLTDESYAADVESAIHETLARARTELVPAAKVAATKSRLRYQFTAQLDNSGDIGAVLASFVQFWRTPETINEVYRSYDALTAGDLRTYADKYFNDAGRVTVTLSSGNSIAGIDGSAPLDALVAARSVMVADGDEAAEIEAVRPPDLGSMSRDGSENEPVSIVALPSASSPLVDVAFLVHAGAALDPAGKKGLATLTAAMVSDGGSSTYTIQQINDAMYPIASGFDAQVDKEMTRLSGQVHKDNLQTWYNLVSGQLLTPGWREQDFKRVKTQLINQIRTDLVGNNDEELGKEVLYAELFGPAHPYGSLNLGDSRDIRSITLDDVKKFYADYYTIRNITIGLAGGYPAEFATRVSGDLQVLPAGERVALDVPDAPKPDGSSATIVEKETPAVAVSFGFPIDLKRGDPDWVALWLARSYFGEHRSTNSHLFQRLRETRGMNYGDYAYVEYFPRGMFQFHPDTNLGRQQQIFQVWVRPLRSNNDAHFATRTALFELNKLIEEGISESDFEASRSFLSKFVSLLMDGQSRQLGYELDSRYYGTDNFASYVRDGLSKLTLADVNRVIRENLDADSIQYVFVAKDAQDLRDRLASDRPSTVTYEAEKPADLLQEDKVIEKLPLGIPADAVRVIKADEVFGRGT